MKYLYNDVKKIEEQNRKMLRELKTLIDKIKSDCRQFQQKYDWEMGDIIDYVSDFYKSSEHLAKAFEGKTHL